jgi:hypothetical protein
MITNFEIITADLSPMEKSCLPDIEYYFKQTLNDKSFIKQHDLTAVINSHIRMNEGDGARILLTTVRLRKYINYFRVNGIMPIIATSEGCKLCYDKPTIESQIKSLLERADSIKAAAEGLKKFL